MVEGFILSLTSRSHWINRGRRRPKIKISIFTDISVLGFYGYIGDISVFINYSKFKIYSIYISKLV